MSKKWWYVVLVFLVLAAAILTVAGFLGTPAVQRLQGGVIIAPAQFPGSANEAEENQDGADFNEGADSEIIPSYSPSPTCWECPAGGAIYNVSMENITDAMVQNMTECMNVSELVNIECPGSETNQTPVCGNGICEANETNVSCVADCQLPTAEANANTQNSGERENVRTEEETNSERVLASYYGITFNDECTRIFYNIQKEGFKEDECDPQTGEVLLSPSHTGEAKYNPPRYAFSVFELFKKMFGLP